MISLSGIQIKIEKAEIAGNQYRKVRKDIGFALISCSTRFIWKLITEIHVLEAYERKGKVTQWTLYHNLYRVWN